MSNRITQYDIGEWLSLLVEQRLIEYGEPLVQAHEAMSELYGDQDDETR